jgi:hypothetical protein
MTAKRAGLPLSLCIAIIDKISYNNWVITEVYLKEVIGNLRNELTHVWGGAFIFGGGAMSLLWVESSPLKWIFFIAGLLLALIFLNAYFIKHTSLKNSRQCY